MLTFSTPTSAELGVIPTGTYALRREQPPHLSPKAKHSGTIRLYIWVVLRVHACYGRMRDVLPASRCCGTRSSATGCHVAKTSSSSRQFGCDIAERRRYWTRGTIKSVKGGGELASGMLMDLYYCSALSTVCSHKLASKRRH